MFMRWPAVWLYLNAFRINVRKNQKAEIAKARSRKSENCSGWTCDTFGENPFVAWPLWSVFVLWAFGSIKEEKL